jgi:hypothetical protein
MKKFHISLILALAGLTACSSLNPSDEKHSPETVEVTYHIKPGREVEMQALLNRAWSIYITKHLVLPRSHAIVTEREYGNRPLIVETFTWVSHSVPDQVPDSIKDIWNQMQDLCEARGGHDGLEINELKTAEPKK